MSISIVSHCIPCYDFLRKVNRVNPLPEELAQMEEETAQGIVIKAYEVVCSDYFKELPDETQIRAGVIENFVWNKAKEEGLIEQIWAETIGKTEEE